MTAADLKCYRSLLMILNFLFLVSGLLLIGLGAYALIDHVDGISETNLSIGLIVIGSLITIVALFGCCGATVENRGLLKAYFAFVLIFLLAQVAIGITAYVLRNDIPEFASNNWSNLTPQGKQEIEKGFQCCGWYNSTDRADPVNCATNSTGGFGFDVGCQQAVEDAIYNNLYIIGATAIAVGALELIVLIFSCCLIQRIPTKEEREKALLEEARRLNREGVDQSYQYQSVPTKV